MNIQELIVQHHFFKIAKKLNMNIKDIQFTKRYGGNIRLYYLKIILNLI